MAEDATVPANVQAYSPQVTLVQMPRWFNLANFFTVLRILLVPFIALDILAGRHIAALALFGMGDGIYALARKILGYHNEPGWTSIMAALCFIGGGILLYTTALTRFSLRPRAR